MIRARREAMLEHEGELAEGITSWLEGAGDIDAECAASILAETILLHRNWIRSQGK